MIIDNRKLLDEEKISFFYCIFSFIMPRLNDLPPEDILPFHEPLPILTAYAKHWTGVSSIEPRNTHRLMFL